MDISHTRIVEWEERLSTILSLMKDYQWKVTDESVDRLDTVIEEIIGVRSGNTVTIDMVEEWVQQLSMVWAVVGSVDQISDESLEYVNNDMLQFIENNR